jgi:hypothetical protein
VVLGGVSWTVVNAGHAYHSPTPAAHDDRAPSAHGDKSRRQAAVDVAVKVVLAVIIAAILAVSGLFLYGAVSGYREAHPSPHQAALERQEQADEGGP